MKSISLTKKKEKLKELRDEVKDFHPLLHELFPKIPRVTRVEYTHGVFENGADFVLAREDDAFGDKEYIGVIAKTGKITQSLSKIEEQIDECDEHRYVCNGKKVIRLDEIWVVTNETISQNAKTKIHRKFSTRKIKFLQNAELITLIDNNFVDFWHDVSIFISTYLSNVRTGIEEYDKSLNLLPAHISDFYIDQKLDKKETSYSRNKKSKKNKTTDIYGLVREENQVVFIEAPPGYGKSKLLRMAAKHYCDQEVFVEESIVPLLITYRDFCNNFEGNLERFIESKVDDRFFSELGDKLKILVLIDGFDEKYFALNDEREKLEELVESSNKHSNVQLVIASRPIPFVEYGKKLLESIAWYELNPLSISGIMSFFDEICKKANMSSRIVEDLQKSQIFKELPKSPIAAILLANLLNDNSNELPSNLTELYEKYSELMLGRWDMHKGLQEQKDYDAALCVILDIANFFITNDITAISIKEAEGFFIKYLSQRNLGIDPVELFEKVTNRSGILQKDVNGNIVYFNHKTFLEFYYAKYKIKNYDPDFIDDRVFSTMWRNIYFFYVGIQKDCEALLEDIVAIEADGEDKLVKVITMADYFLAGFATPYRVIEKHLPTLLIEYAKTYKDIIDGKIKSSIRAFPEMALFYLFQALSRNCFSYEFFLDALELCIVEILDNETIDETTKIHALYFIYVVFIDLEQENPFDNLLENFGGKIPVQMQIAIEYETKDVKNVSAILRKQRKKFAKMQKRASPNMKKSLDQIFNTPLEDVKKIAKSD